MEGQEYEAVDNAGASSAEKTDKKKRATFKQVMQMMPDIIEGIQKPRKVSGLPPFKRKFIRFKPTRGPMQVFEVHQGEVVTHCELDVVAQSICTWANTFKNDTTLMQDWDDLLDADKCTKVARAWLYAFVESAVEDLPPAVRFKSEKGYCFHRLPFDLEPCDTLAAPTWQEILGRMTNSEAFAMRVASLFVPGTQRRQTVWLSGEANSGKSVVTGSLGLLMGDAFASVECKVDDFWKSILVGKRAVVIHEADPRFLRLPIFKSITGDDMHLVNEKREKRFMARIDAMFFMTSNQEPEIPKEKALLSRIIHCQVSPIPPEVPRERAAVVEARLWKEMPAFLSWAMGLYKAKVGSEGIIPADMTSLELAAEEYESIAMDFLTANFVVDAGASVTRTRMEEILRNACVMLNPQQKHEWKTAWKRIGIKEVKAWVSEMGETRWVYRGIRERRASERVVRLFSASDIPDLPECDA